MKLQSKISLLFFIAFLLLTAFFVSYGFILKTQYLHKTEKRYTQTALICLSHFNESQKSHKKPNFLNEDFLYLVESHDLMPLADESIDFLVKDISSILIREIGSSTMEIFEVNNTFYLSLKHKNFQLLFSDKESFEFPFELLLLYLLSLLFLFIFYLWLIDSLKPLKNLHNKILLVEGGDLSVSFKSEKNDEIAQVSNAFEFTLRKIEGLINSRQLFLRTIMHELKTPIGKGLLVNEFLENKKHKEHYRKIFERLELLIEEFSKIEQMLSSSYTLNLAHYNAQEMIDQALELMFMSEAEIEKRVSIKQIEPFIVKTDYTLFSLALKNLIDNGLKYSNEQKVKIEIYKNRLEISNEAEEFMNSLEEFTQPFNPKGQGLGLGLYIVQNIIDMLKLEFGYIYKNGVHTFSIFR